MGTTSGLPAMELSKAQFKPRALEYFRRVQETGEEIIVTDRGRRAVRISPYHPEQRHPFKAVRGSVKRYDDPEAPVGEPWDAEA